MTAVRKCKRCAKNLYGRKDKVYCGNACRFADWSEGRNDDPRIEPCHYCGLPADTVDHVPPQCARPHLEELGLRGRYPFFEVRACRECNGLLGARPLWQLAKRKDFIKRALRRRYKRYLRTPSWTDSEIAHLDYNLQQIVLNGLAIKELVGKRLAW